MQVVTANGTPPNGSSFMLGLPATLDQREHGNDVHVVEIWYQ